MAKLPRLSGKEVVKALSKVGFISVRQKGSHLIMKKQTAEGEIGLVVPMHKEIDKGTLLEKEDILPYLAPLVLEL